MARHLVGELTARNFGLLIAYLIPGFVALWGVSVVSPPVSGWLAGPSPAGPTIGGFLFVTLASLAAGMTASAIRWVLLDTLHHATGLKRPSFNDVLLDRKLTAFDYLVQNHYRYYQFYGNTLVAILFAYPLYRLAAASPATFTPLDVAVLLLECVFFAASRDALRNYYVRASRLLTETESEVSHDKRQLPRPGSGPAAQSAEGSKDAAAKAQKSPAGP